MRLVLEDLAIGYYRKALISDLSAVIDGPTLVQVLGPNGVGKTTLLRTVAGLVKPLRGRILVDGVDITGDPGLAGVYVSLVPQIASTLTNLYPMSLWEFVRFAADLRYGASSTQHNDLIARTLELVGLPSSVWHMDMRKLSGGQRQKAFIARALLSNTPIMLLDEPLSSIDQTSKPQIIRLILELSYTHLVIVTTHDPTLLLESTGSVLLIGSDRYFFGPPSKVMKLEVLREVYGDVVVHVDRCLHIADTHM